MPGPSERRACNAAQGHTYDIPRYDGNRFCGELALHSGTQVYASDRSQRYSYGVGVAIDFGNWKGMVYCYSPVTGLPSVVTPGLARR